MAPNISSHSLSFQFQCSAMVNPGKGERMEGASHRILGTGSGYDPAKVCLICCQLLQRMKWKCNRVLFTILSVFGCFCGLKRGFRNQNFWSYFGTWVKFKVRIGVVPAPPVLSLIIVFFGPLLCRFLLLLLAIGDLPSYSLWSLS